MNDIECPYCGYEFNTDEMDEIIGDRDGEYSEGDLFEYSQCPECDKHLRLSREVIVEYTIIGADDN